MSDGDFPLANISANTSLPICFDISPLSIIWASIARFSGVTFESNRPSSCSRASCAGASSNSRFARRALPSLPLSQELAPQIVYYEICYRLRVLRIRFYCALKIFAYFRDVAHYGRRRIRQTEFRHIPALAVEWNLGQFRAHRFEILARNLYRHQVGIGGSSGSRARPPLSALAG